MTFRLTNLAQQDFDGIGAYTLEIWGYTQAEKYLTQLNETFTALAQNPTLGRARKDLRRNLFSCSCNKHVIFFRRDARNNVEILRILHERMDFARHL